MLQAKTAINASRAIRNDFIQPKFLFKSNTMQLCLPNYTIPRVVQLKTIVLYCRRNARFPVHTSPPRKFSECAARCLIRPGKVCSINFEPHAVPPPLNECNPSASMALSCQNQIFIVRSYTQCLPKIAQKVKDNG